MGSGLVLHSIILRLDGPDPLGLCILSCLLHTRCSISVIILLSERRSWCIHLLIETSDVRLSLFHIGSDIGVVVRFYVRPSIVSRLEIRFAKFRGVVRKIGNG